jgi:enterochelin esterase-like enzyme
MSVSFNLALRARIHRYLNQDSVITERKSNFRSVHLSRKVELDIFLPPDYFAEKENYPVVYFNDGQDMTAIRMEHLLEQLYFTKRIRRVIVVAIHCGSARVQEYGTASTPDFAKRGSQAGKYTDFVVKELVPYINSRYHTLTDAANTAFAGFSLGGLSALDISWANPEVFANVGVFSGSLWWRKKALDKGYTDADRIMHSIIRESEKREGMKFWLQTGTNDETKDRNKNGVIDSIDDTLDLIMELEQKGYSPEKSIRYLEIKGGRHDQETWAKAMPDFLEWTFGYKN